MLDYKFALSKYDINNTRFVDMEICAEGKWFLEVLSGRPGTTSTSSSSSSSSSSSFLGSTAQLRPWPPPQNPTEFLGGFAIIFFFTG
jgi:hypothetical protein